MPARHDRKQINNTSEPQSCRRFLHTIRIQTKHPMVLERQRYYRFEGFREFLENLTFFSKSITIDENLINLRVFLNNMKTQNNRINT